MKSKHLINATLALGVLFALSAHAGDGASATVDSDYRARNLNLQLDAGQIDVKNAKIEVDASYLRDSDGRNGVSAEVHASKKYVLTDRPEREGGTFGIVMLKPGIDARADVTISPDGKPNLQRVDAQVSGVTLFHVEGFAGHESAKARADRQGLMEREHLLAADFLKKDAELEDQARRTTDETQRSDISAAREKLRMEYNAAIATVKHDAGAAGFALDEFGRYEEKGDLVHFAAEANGASVSGIYRETPELGQRQAGALFTFADASLHGAFTINGLNVDLCGKVLPIALLAGINEKKNFYESAASACLGVRLGKLGHLGNEFTATTDWGGAYKLADSTTLKDIGGTPIGISHTFEYEHAQDGTVLQRNLIGVRTAF